MIQSGVQEMYAQIVYKDNKIMELNNKILDHEKKMMDLQEFISEKNEVIKGRDKVFEVSNTENWHNIIVINTIFFLVCLAVYSIVSLAFNWVFWKNVGNIYM